MRDHAANRRDLHAEIRILDDQTGPRRLHERAFGDGLARAADERGEHGDRAWSQGFGDTEARQHAGRGIEPKGADLVDRRLVVARDRLPRALR